MSGTKVNRQKEKGGRLQAKKGNSGLRSLMVELDANKQKTLMRYLKPPDEMRKTGEPISGKRAKKIKTAGKFSQSDNCSQLIVSEG
ncbi:MAG: hypothetical protein QXX99_06080 [Candidatus Bathyarchaeia archaeon]